METVKTVSMVPPQPKELRPVEHDRLWEGRCTSLVTKEPNVQIVHGHDAIDSDYQGLNIKHETAVFDIINKLNTHNSGNGITMPAKSCDTTPC